MFTSFSYVFWYIFFPGSVFVTCNLDASSSFRWLLSWRWRLSREATWAKCAHSISLHWQNWHIRHSWADSWGIDWHRLRSMQIRSFNEFSAERTKSLITSSSPRQVFWSLPLSLWSPIPAINTHHRTSRAGAKKCAPNEQASEIHPAKSNPWIATPRLRIFGCNDAKCANCRLGGSSIANVLFPSASSGPSPQSEQRSRPAQCILYSTFLNEPTPWVWVLLGTVDLTVGDTLVIQILSQLRPAGMPVPAHYPQSQLDLEGLWSLLGKMDQNGVKDGHVRNARSLCLCEDPSGLPSLSLPSCDESKKFLVV